MNNLIFNDKTIFQICINLNDDIEELKKSRKKLLDLNSDWSYFCIQSQEQFNQIMIEQFKYSNNEFENKIYDLFDSVPEVLVYGQKCRKAKDLDEREKVHEVCKLVSQTDIFRLAMIYKFGGLYFDLSSELVIDIESSFSKYNCCLVRSDKEVRTSMLYAKKNNDIVKKILSSSIDKVSESKREGTKIMQMSLAGPTHWTNVILNEIKQEGLEENNAKIFWENELIGWEMMSTWKRELHTPSSKNPLKKINQHWLKDY